MLVLHPIPAMTSLSPAAQAVLQAACIHHGLFNEEIVQRRRNIAAALRAAAQQLPDVRWGGCIQPDAEMSLGINWSRDALHAIAAELEGAQ